VSLVKKKLQEINKKNIKIANKKKQIKLTKPIEVHNTYKDLIKKNSIFKDLKDLKKEIKKNTPHFFFNLNDNSNNYLAKLKKINFNKKYPNLHSEDYGDWIGCIIFADVYFRTKTKWADLAKGKPNDPTYICRIGYSIDHDWEKLKPHSWFYEENCHRFESGNKLDNMIRAYKTYNEMMSYNIESLIELSRDKNIVYKKPIGGLFNTYKKSYEFTESVNLTNFEKKNSFLAD
tara:strand:+ start:1793 stop:2488 length:696 start_codon:yes stop_codon:yes gene_type:complete